jgi:hypothetical protein
MPCAGGENPKAGDTVEHRSGEVGTVFELDLQAARPINMRASKMRKLK